MIDISLFTKRVKCASNITIITKVFIDYNIIDAKHLIGNKNANNVKNIIRNTKVGVRYRLRRYVIYVYIMYIIH